VAAALTEDWNGQDTTIASIERELARLREASTVPGSAANLRTSVMTHCAWVPPGWLDAAEATLAGLAERHPSRTLILVPLPDEPDGLDAELSLRCFASGGRHVCGEVIELRLRGNRAQAPASIVLPLVISDLPVFCRWRGEPPFGDAPWEQLVDLADRVIVDSSEWDELSYEELAGVFERTAISDIAWARLRDWRLELAGRWPEIREQEIYVSGPPAEGALLRGWLTSRLERTLRPVADAAELGVRLGGEQVAPPHAAPASPSDLLSAELDRFTSDHIYEQAVLAAR
jgi:glucose-6-phosphate dehydrogenase assembly protein OpcA